jgi:DNA-directed RNA polymerase specialized sigma24 family protein
MKDENNIHENDIKNILFTLDEILDEYEKFVSLKKYMKTLTTKEKIVMILKIKYKASFEDIGFKLNLTVASVRSAYSRSNAKLLKSNLIL